MSSIMSRIRLGFVGLSVVALMASGVAASPAMAHKRNHKATGKSVRQSANGGSASANGGNGGNGGTTICPNNSAQNGQDGGKDGGGRLLEGSSKLSIGAAAGCAFNGNGGNGGWGGKAEGGDGGQNANISVSS